MSGDPLDALDLSQLPADETDEYEFKSSLVKSDDLKAKLGKAASGFANAGGGFFIVGVDGGGAPDGGISQQVGKQPLLDWVDQEIQRVEPPPKFAGRLITEIGERGVLTPGFAVLAIHFPTSNAGPHMAPDHRYYIRAGRQTVPARHFIVESIRARRNLLTPRLAHTARVSPFAIPQPYIFEGTLFALNDAPALDVSISIPDAPADCDFEFPLRTEVIDRGHPFPFNFLTPSDELGFTLDVEFSDLNGARHAYRARATPTYRRTGWYSSNDPGRSIVTAIEKIAKEAGRDGIGFRMGP